MGLSRQLTTPQASGKRPLGLWDLCLWEQVLVFGNGSLGSFALVDVLRAHLSVL